MKKTISTSIILLLISLLPLTPTHAGSAYDIAFFNSTSSQQWWEYETTTATKSTDNWGQAPILSEASSIESLLATTTDAFESWLDTTTGTETYTIPCSTSDSGLSAVWNSSGSSSITTLSVPANISATTTGFLMITLTGDNRTVLTSLLLEQSTSSSTSSAPPFPGQTTITTVLVAKNSSNGGQEYTYTSTRVSTAGAVSILPSVSCFSLFLACLCVFA